nr:MAG TPA: Major capsid protein [Microviridae sp.]
MAHFTGLKSLQNHVHKSGHDLSAKNCFTAKVGELLPVWFDFGIPNSTYKFNLEYFTRTRPVQTSAYTRIREYFDFFAVPCDLIWKSFDSAVIQMGEKAPLQSKDLLTNLTVKGDLPHCSLQDLHHSLYFAGGSQPLGVKVSVVPGYENIFGYNRGDVNHKLLSMLDYGNVIQKTSSDFGNTSNRWWNGSAAPSSADLLRYSQKYNVNLAVNLFPLAAYQKIYQDFFRWSQWEKADPTSYNFDWYAGSGNVFGPTGLSSSIPPSNDYWKRDNLFSLRYANWNKDKFMGILPNSQFGDLAVVDLGTMSLSNSKIPVGAYDGINDTGDFHQMQTQAESVNTGSSSNSKSTPIYPRDSDSISVREKANLWAVLGESPNLSLKFSILALRQAEALQKWKEITQSVDTDYRDQIKAHFGVNVPQSESHMAKYIGGIARNLDISEVINQFLPSGADSQAYIYGKGVGSGQGSMTFNTGSGYYILMCIYHAVPLLDYALSSPDGQHLATSIEDLPIPEFDNIGMESVPAVELMNSFLYSNVNSADKILGYNPRYYNWKTKIDRIHGAFTTTLKDWVSPIDDSFLYSLFGGDLSTYKGVTWPFFKVNPNTLDDIFAVKVNSVWDTDQLLVNANVGCYATRPLSADGVPY